MNTSTLVQKLWNYCNVLRDDGMSYGDYVEQACCSSRWRTSAAARRITSSAASPAAYAWPALLAKDCDALFDHYRHTLEELGKQPGTLALIFARLSQALGRRRPPGSRMVVTLIRHSLSHR